MVQNIENRRYLGNSHNGRDIATMEDPARTERETVADGNSSLASLKLDMIQHWELVSKGALPRLLGCPR